MRLILCILPGILTVTLGALLMSDVYELARWCNEQPDVNGTEDDVNDILMGYLPETKHGMCMLWCMEVKTGILVNNKFDVKGTYEFFRGAFPECPYYKNIERGVMFCARLIQRRADNKIHHCQYAHMVASCIKRRIKYVPGCRAAFYRPFVWKNLKRRVTMKPAKKYFELKRRPPPEPVFEIITRPPKNYSLSDIHGRLASESNEDGPYMYLPPRMRKGKGKFNKRKGRREGEEGGRKKGKEGDGEPGDKSGLDESRKERRHKKKPIL